MREDVNGSSRRARSRIVAITGAILAANIATCLPAQAYPPFLETLKNIGATPEELKKFNELYSTMNPEEKAKADKNDVNYLRNGLDYFRAVWAGEAAHPLLKAGAPMPAFSLKGVDDKIYSPASFKDAKVVVVAFMSNHCPASQMSEGRIMQLVTDYAKRGVAFVAIQPDAPNAAAPSELGFTDVDDGLAGMKERARYRSYNLPYLDDGELQVVTKAFGPKTTPHVFIFDQDRKLRYEGRIDNHLRADKATTHEARDAIELLLAGKPVPVAHTPTFGCSIKWADQTALADRERDEWKAMPIKVETATLEQLTALRKTPSDKTRIINFWATWCGPCKVELPELVKTYQWYQGRDVELVTVSVDDPANRAGVKKFLEKIHAPVRNLQVDTSDLFAVQAAFDPDWQSGVPYTLVLAPDGRVIYRQEGEVDILKMRRAILANIDGPGGFVGNADYWKSASR